jgi:hypothetical protein
MEKEKREATTTTSTACARGRPRFGRRDLGRRGTGAPLQQSPAHAPAAEGGGAPCPVPTPEGVRVRSLPLFSVVRIDGSARSRRRAMRSSLLWHVATRWSAPAEELAAAPARGSLGGARGIRMAATRRRDVL